MLAVTVASRQGWRECGYLQYMTTPESGQHTPIVSLLFYGHCTQREARLCSESAPDPAPDLVSTPSSTQCAVITEAGPGSD